MRGRNLSVGEGDPYCLHPSEVSTLRVLALFFLVLAPFACAGLQNGNALLIERPDWGRYFRAAGVRGTLVLMKDGSAEIMVFDQARARQGFRPASSFKILNACVALETGVVAGPDAVIPWDGTKRSVAAWNKDLTLREAFASSSVPAFQGLARAVGPERMTRYVQASGYGNADIGGGIDVFWLEGNLRISAVEQVEFLKRLHDGKLPFSTKTIESTKDIMTADKGDGWTIRAKTGWTGRTKPSIGWWVGWVERGGEAWYFALNIDMESPEQAKARQSVVMAALKGEAVLP